MSKNKLWWNNNSCLSTLTLLFDINKIKSTSNYTSYVTQSKHKFTKSIKYFFINQMHYQLTITYFSILIIHKIYSIKWKIFYFYIPIFFLFDLSHFNGILTSSLWSANMTCCIDVKILKASDYLFSIKSKVDIQNIETL